ncbi:hypothetical protein SPBR_03331 [Sporothrix brasiliensis 5110]|uniref:Ribosome biogenesis protein ALB1 n=1 Tax=Sporothrix brasiliensis 5110 TaxID=1398154 RepID=A0A0C2F113_9PEZI|nr:uncharacterized protein SPBR_03331 [Sporothrix brasiliensis 5110]KIH92539.1 hypothetical protein SPBR_03331 [Sporothrix brasiliensis 5110]
MPSVKNPNKQSRNRVAARAATKRKQQAKSSADGRHKQDRVAKADTKRGARPGLLPTSGPRAPLSAKKKKKVIQRMTLALKRKMEANGGKLPDDVMADAKESAPVEEEMADADIQ